MLTPYPIRRNDDGTISFTTEAGVVYTAAFLDASYHFDDVQGVFEFNLYPDGDVPRPDKRVGLTVIYILDIFFQDADTVLLYICESLDKRHFARKRKFDSWFRQYGEAFEKHDYELQVEGTHILISLILKKNNPRQQVLLQAFQETYNLYDSYK